MESKSYTIDDKGFITVSNSYLEVETKQKFKPNKTGRYLRGEVSEQIRKSDLVNFNKHLRKVHYARPMVDTHPPRMNPFVRLNKKKLHEDGERAKRIDADNKDLLKKISVINRCGGKVDCYNPDAYRTINKWRGYNKNMKALEKANEKMYRLIKNPPISYPRAEHLKDWNRNLSKMNHISRYPLLIVQKPDLDEKLSQEQSISYLMRCNRPELRSFCFLEFSVKDGKFLGRLIIELFYDHVPVTVQNFMELCKGDHLSYKNNLVHRIILGEYMEMGDITQSNGRGGFSIYGKSFEEENHKLKHTKAGVLSMKRVGWAENNSQFCITFKKMERLDNKNVVFGNVVKGNHMLMNMQYYGRKIGKPLGEVVISDCGEYFVHDDFE